MTTDRRFESRNSGPRWNQLVDRIVEKFWERVDFIEEGLTADGYPPFTVPLSPLEQYQRLSAWRQAGDRRFWDSAEAQTTLDELSLQYGQPGPIAPITGVAPPL